MSLAVWASDLRNGMALSVISKGIKKYPQESTIVFNSVDLVTTTSIKLPKYRPFKFAVRSCWIPTGSPQSQSSWVYGILEASQM